eukprot:808794-Rhodomonas_salina.1
MVAGFSAASNYTFRIYADDPVQHEQVPAAFKFDRCPLTLDEGESRIDATARGLPGGGWLSWRDTRWCSGDRCRSWLCFSPTRR